MRRIVPTDENSCDSRNRKFLRWFNEIVFALECLKANILLTEKLQDSLFAEASTQPQTINQFNWKVLKASKYFIIEVWTHFN